MPMKLLSGSADIRNAAATSVAACQGDGRDARFRGLRIPGLEDGFVPETVTCATAGA